MDSFYYSRFSLIKEAFQTFEGSFMSQDFTTLTQEEITWQFEKFVKASKSFEETPLIYLESAFYNYSIDNLESYRNFDLFELNSDFTNQAS